MISYAAMKTYRQFSPHQGLLFPPSPHDWLADGHLAYFILDVVTQLDLSEIFAPYEREERGFPPHHPQMMVGLLLYGYCTGVTSSRKLEKATWEDVATRVVSGGTHPDHSCIADFRARHREAFKKLFLDLPDAQPTEAPPGRRDRLRTPANGAPCAPSPGPLPRWGRGEDSKLDERSVAPTRS